jgi:DNA-binding NtrC family response regulator
MARKNVLLVEDEPEQSEHYQDMLRCLGYAVYAAYTKDQAIEHLQKDAIDILITDIHLTNSYERNSFEGFELLEYVRANNPECLVIAMSNDPKLSTYHRAIELGAMNYAKKPVLSHDEFQLTIANAQERKGITRLKEMEAREERKLAPSEKVPDGLVLDDATREAAYLLAQAKEIACIIYGETGTGKEEVAKLIHKKRVEAEGPIPFVAVNCANLDSATATSHLFGHKKGSFTGADTTTIGYVGEANGGILFLDEIHTLSIDNQRKLLRVLNDGTYQRFGDTKTLRSDFQVIVATGKDLDELVRVGQFIPDLRSRITGMLITLKPLRERLDDLDLLVPLIFNKVGAHVEPADLSSIINRCKEFYWQDNIRQLFNTLKSTAILCQCRKRPVTAKDLLVFPSMYNPNEQKSALDVQSEQQRIMAALTEDYDYGESMDLYEKILLRNAVKRHRQFSKVVEKIKISRSTLETKRKKYELDAGE